MREGAAPSFRQNRANALIAMACPSCRGSMLPGSTVAPSSSGSVATTQTPRCRYCAMASREGRANAGVGAMPSGSCAANPIAMPTGIAANLTVAAPMTSAASVSTAIANSLTTVAACSTTAVIGTAAPVFAAAGTSTATAPMLAATSTASASSATPLTATVRICCGKGLQRLVIEQDDWRYRESRASEERQGHPKCALLSHREVLR